MSKKVLVFIFAIVAFLGFKVSVKAAYVSFYDEENGNKIGYMEHVHEADITVADPTRTGYDFQGWSSNDPQISFNNGRIIIDLTIPGASNNTPRDVFATWAPTQYTINYDLAGGNATNPDNYTIEDTDITLTNPTRDGYDFAGWQDENGTDLGMNVTISTGSIGDRTFVATWTPIVYNINYDLNGGSVSNPNPTSYTPDDSDIILNNPTLAGYNFIGWQDENGIDLGMNVTIPTGSIGDRTFIATWEEIVEDDEVVVSTSSDDESATLSTSNPATGDNIAIYFVLMMLSMSGLAFCKKVLFD